MKQKSWQIAKNKNYRGIMNRLVVHLLVLLLLIIAPTMLTAWGLHRWFSIVPFKHISLVVLVFYVNYLFLVDRYLLRGYKVKFALYNLCIILVLCVVMAITHSEMWLYVNVVGDMPPMPGFPPPLPPPSADAVPEVLIVDTFQRQSLRLLEFLYRDVMLLSMSIGLSVAIKLNANWVNIENEKQTLIAEKRESELQNLKQQLNPHFLFNTLNNIYVLIGLDQNEARKSVHELSQLLRYVLYDSNIEKVPLAKELDFVKHYIELMRLRLHSQVRLDWTYNHTVLPVMKWRRWCLYAW